MITIRNWMPTISSEESLIAYVGENETVRREFLVTGDGWETYSGWSFYLDMAFDLSGVTSRDSWERQTTTQNQTESITETGTSTTSTETRETRRVTEMTVEDVTATDIASLEKAVTEDGILLGWTVRRQHTQLPGRLRATLRALGPGGEVKKSEMMNFEVLPAVIAEAAAVVPASAFEEMEQRMGALYSSTVQAAGEATAAETAAETSAQQAQSAATMASQAYVAAGNSASRANGAAIAAQEAQKAAELAEENAKGYVTDAENTVKAALAEAKASGEFDGKDGQDGGYYVPSITDDGENLNFTFTPTKEEMGTTDVFVISKPTSGTNGKDGVGVESVTQTTTSTEDGGQNLITVALSDGTSGVFAVRNGSKGSTGEKGDPGENGEDGQDGVSPVVVINPIDGGHRMTVGTATDTTVIDIMDGEKGEIGAAGADGKSAYAYAQDGGYTGTEEEFAEKLAAATPTQLPNPKNLAFIDEIGTTDYYDGSAEKTLVLRKVIYVAITMNDDGSFSASETYRNISDYIALGYTVCCVVDGYIVPLFCFANESVDFVLTIAAGDAFLTYLVSIAPDDSVLFEPIETSVSSPTLEPLNIKIGTSPNVIYDGTNSKTVLVQSVKNPYALTVNGTTYDGSEAVDFTDTINGMIDAKLAEIPNASGVSF